MTHNDFGNDSPQGQHYASGLGRSEKEIVKLCQAAVVSKGPAIQGMGVLSRREPDEV